MAARQVICMASRMVESIGLLLRISIKVTKVYLLMVNITNGYYFMAKNA